MINTVSVLVVEDTTIMQKMAKIILTDLACKIDIAEDGKKALDMFKQNSYNIIFMDIGLPDINGVDVTKAIRNLENNQSHVPIIALTANYDESYKPVCLNAGMDDFMLKPLTKDKAKAMINKFVTKGASVSTDEK